MKIRNSTVYCTWLHVSKEYLFAIHDHYITGEYKSGSAVADLEEGPAPPPLSPGIYHLMLVKLKIWHPKYLNLLAILGSPPFFSKFLDPQLFCAAARQNPAGRWRCNNVEFRFRRWFNVDPTFIQHCVPAGKRHWRWVKRQIRRNTRSTSSVEYKLMPPKLTITLRDLRYWTTEKIDWMWRWFLMNPPEAERAQARLILTALRPAQECFTYRKTSPLPVKGCKI
jgi:hypothetical protein